MRERKRVSCHCIAAGHCKWHDKIVSGEELKQCLNGIPPTEDESKPCIYLGRKEEGENEYYKCNLLERCTLEPNQEGLPDCSQCNHKLRFDGNLIEDFVDPLRVHEVDGTKTTAHRNMLRGGSAFLVCGGPSAKEVEYTRLKERGIFSLGINNAAAWCPVDAFLCSGGTTEI